MIKIIIKWLKRLILVFAIIPVLAFLGFAGAVSLIDFNKYKPQIESEVSQLINREFSINGSIEASVLPFKFSLEKLSAKNPEGFKEPLLLELDELHIELSLYKLFVDRKIEIISLEAIAPKLNLIQTERTRNWQDLPLLARWIPESQLDQLPQLFAQEFSTRHESQALSEFNSAFLKKTSTNFDPDIPSVSAPNNPEHNWYLESLVVKDAELAFIDEAKEVSLTLKKANLVTFDVQPHRPFKISSDFVYHHSQSPRVFEFDVNGDLKIQANYSQLLFTDWNGIFMLKLPPEDNLPDVRFATTGKKLLVDFEQKQVDVSQAVIDGMEVKVITSYKGSLGFNSVFEGELYTNDSNLFNWIKRLGFPEAEADNEAKGRYEFRWDGQELNLRPVKDAV